MSLIAIGSVTRITSSNTYDWCPSHRSMSCVGFHRSVCAVNREPHIYALAWSRNGRPPEMMKAERRAMFRFDVLDDTGRLRAMARWNIEIVEVHGLHFIVGVVVLGRRFSVHGDPDFEAGE